MKRVMILLSLCVMCALLTGCNTAGSFVSATGLYIETGIGRVIVGTVDASNSAGEFANERFSVKHTTFFNTGVGQGGTVGNTEVAAEKRSEYTMKVTPVEAEPEADEE